MEDNVGVNTYKVILIKKDFSHLFKIKNAIDNNELICIHADRYIDGNNTIPVNFFNKIIRIPEGPFALASKLNVPYSFVFCVRNSIYEYRFSATKPQFSSDKNFIAEQFVSELEKKILRYPEQWFNYFNIFEAGK